MSNASNTILHCHQLGQGPNILLAFHGIGQTGLTCFQSLATALGNHYTIYAFDLFFHGQSRGIHGNDSFSEQDIVTKPAWKKLIAEFLVQNTIERFDILAFSMGGRFALATLEAFPEKIDKTFLIAPDGVSEHPIYTLASRFGPTRKLFHWVLQNPEMLLKSAGFLEKLGLIHSSLIRFTQFMLADPKRQETIYRSWLAFRMLKFDIPSLYQSLHSTEVYLFIGKYDKLLKAKDVQILAGLLPDGHYFLLPAGHTNLVDKARFVMEDLVK